LASSDEGRKGRGKKKRGEFVYFCRLALTPEEGSGTGKERKREKKKEKKKKTASATTLIEYTSKPMDSAEGKKGKKRKKKGKSTQIVTGNSLWGRVRLVRAGEEKKGKKKGKKKKKRVVLFGVIDPPSVGPKEGGKKKNGKIVPYVKRTAGWGKGGKKERKGKRGITVTEAAGPLWTQLHNKIVGLNALGERKK